MKNSATVFSIGILLICTFFTKVVIDFTLVPRFFLLSIFSLFFYVYFYVVGKKNVQFNVIHLIALVYFSFILFSSTWALNHSLAIVEGAKNLLYFFIILFTTNLLRSNEEEVFGKLIKTSIILFFIFLFFFTKQALQIQNYSKIDLYSLKGLSGHKNLFSIFVFFSLIYSFLGIFEFKKAWKIIAIISLFIQVAILIFIQTRSVWIGLLVFIVTVVLILISKSIISKISIRKTILFSLFFIIVINLFFILLLPKVLDYYKFNLQSSSAIEAVTDPSSINERVLVWNKTYQFFQKNIFFGVGANNWQIHFPSTSLPESYVIRDLNVTFQRPHNDFLWIISEYGLIGFNLFLLIIVPVCFFLYREVIINFSYKLVIILSGLVAFFCISFFDFPKERIELSLLFYILLSFGFHYSKNSSFNLIKNEIKPGFILNGGIIILLSLIIFIAFLNFRGEFYTKKMYVQQKLGRGEEIIKFSEKASSFCYKMDPITFPLKWYSGTAYAQKEDYKNAMIDFKEAFILHPFNYNLLNDMGSVNYVNGEIDSAIYYYMRSIEINPRYDEPKLNLISIHINKNDYGFANKIDSTLYYNSELRSYYRKLIDDGLNKN